MPMREPCLTRARGLRAEGMLEGSGPRVCEICQPSSLSLSPPLLDTRTPSHCFPLFPSPSNSPPPHSPLSLPPSSPQGHIVAEVCSPQMEEVLMRLQSSATLHHKLSLTTLVRAMEERGEGEGRYGEGDRGEGEGRYGGKRDSGDAGRRLGEAARPMLLTSSAGLHLSINSRPEPVSCALNPCHVP